MRSFNRLAILVLMATQFHISFAWGDPPSSTAPKAFADNSEKSPQANDASGLPSESPGASSNSREGIATDSGKPEPPATARQYLEAGAKLHNKGRYELAARYLKAAYLYKDRLTLNEQIVLGVYREKVEQQLKRLSTPVIVEAPPRDARFSTDKIDPSVNAAATTSSSNLPESSVEGLDTDRTALDNPQNPIELSSNRATARAGEIEDDPLQKLYGSETSRNSDDTKQRGRWLLQLSREQIFRGNLNKARELLATVRTMNISWGYFDDSPEKVTEALAKAEELKLAGPLESSNSKSFDRRTAKARLREARAALIIGELGQAEAIADEVRAWRVGFYFFDDTPEKLYSAIDSARRKQGSRSGKPESSRPAADSTSSGFPDSSTMNLEVPSNYLKGTRFAPTGSPVEMSELPR